MENRHPFRDWTPDLADLGNPGLLRANGCVPEGIGYGPQPGLVAVTAPGALDATARGSLATTDQGGNAYNFAGDDTKLYLLDNVGTWADVSRAAGYNLATRSRWRFAQFDNRVIAASLEQELQYYDLRSSTVFAPVTEDQSGPRANHVGVVKDFVVAGDIYTQLEGLIRNGIQWSAQRNPLVWPEPGSDEALGALSDLRRLKGEGGNVQAVVSGAEIGAVFQERVVNRMDFVGGQTVFEINDVQAARGLLVPGLAIPYGRLILFLAEDGWYLFDYTEAYPVGEDRVNRTFLADLDSDYFHRVSWITDPARPLSLIGYPGSGNSGGTPNKVLVWNWKEQRFSDFDLTHEILARYIAPGIHLDDQSLGDDLDALVDTLDQRQVALDAAVTGAFNTSHQIGTLTGPNLAAQFESADFEIRPGGRSLLNRVRPLIKGTTAATVEVAGLGKSGDTISYGAATAAESDGDHPARANGRFHRVRINVPAAESWNEAVGFDYDAQPVSGKR